MYEVTYVNLIEPQIKVDIPYYTTSPTTLRKELKRNSRAKKVVVVCHQIKCSVDRFNKLKKACSQFNDYGLSREDRLWISNYVRSFDFATVQEKKALFKVLIEIIKRRS